jgi:hypothetical protein
VSEALRQSPLRLTVIVIGGPLRDRLHRTLDALAAQTIAGDLEVILADLSPESGQLERPQGPAIRVLACPGATDVGLVKAEAVRAAGTPLVAFLEDHAFPEQNWAETVVRAFDGPWAAVGYAFTNANPTSYASRALMMATYGPWQHPARRGPMRRLPGNNVAYRRAALLALGEELDALLAIDFNVQEAVRRSGGGLFLEAHALAAHENFTRFTDFLGAGRAYCHLLAAQRSRSWSRPRRLAYALAVPVAAPMLRLGRLAAGLRGRRALWPTFAMSLPLIILAYVSDAAAEAFGYAFGTRDAEAAFVAWEVMAPRDGT